MPKPRSSINLGISKEATCLLILRHPEYRWHELNAGFYLEQENLSSGCQEKISSCQDSKIESIDAWHGGGNFRSSEEVSVMEMERREVVIRFLFMDEN